MLRNLTWYARLILIYKHTIRTYVRGVPTYFWRSAKSLHRDLVARLYASTTEDLSGHKIEPAARNSLIAKLSSQYCNWLIVLFCDKKTNKNLEKLKLWLSVGLLRHGSKAGNTKGNRAHCTILKKISTKSERYLNIYIWKWKDRKNEKK